MKKSLKKTLFAGVAALSFVAVAGVSSTNASAKSYAKVTSNKALTTDATTRNVAVNGTNALYTKAGTLKGAKTVATKTTLASLKNSKQGQKNFRAYRVATTNRGSVYYKVVSFDKTYRGWIYGGKSVTAFAGGIASFSTTTAPAAANSASASSASSASSAEQTTALTDAQKNATYKITKAGTANDGTATTYSYPAWTEYKKGRTVTDATPYANDTFKVTDQTTRTREGDLWVKIADTNATNGQKINGWIKYSALTAQATTPTTTPVADNAVRINFTDVSGKTIKSVDFTKTGSKKGDNLGQLTKNANGVYSWNLSNLSSSDQNSLQNAIDTALTGTGYSFKIGDPDSSNAAVLAQATTGNTVNIPLTKGATVYQGLTAFANDTNNKLTEGLGDTINYIPTTNPNASVATNAFKTITVKATPENGLASDFTHDFSDIVDTTTGAFDSAKFAADVNALTGAASSSTTTGTADQQKAQRITDLNAALAYAAAHNYVTPASLNTTDLFSGNTGASYSSQDVLNYVNKHDQLKTLKSSAFPVANADGTVASWKQFTFTVSGANGGVFGNGSAKVNYNFNSALPTTLTSFPAKTQSNTTNPFA
ncbi:MAG: S-layer protein [Lactobacillus sp.]|nr:S-layer protein [Lactobacillus sp.]